MGVLTDFFRASEPELRGAFYRPALIGPPDGPWINELPDSFVLKLAALAPRELEPTAAEWGESEREDMTSIRDKSARDRMLQTKTPEYWRAILDALSAF